MEFAALKDRPLVRLVTSCANSFHFLFHRRKGGELDGTFKSKRELADAFIPIKING